MFNQTAHFCSCQQFCFLPCIMYMQAEASNIHTSWERTWNLHAMKITPVIYSKTRGSQRSWITGELHWELLAKMSHCVPVLLKNHGILPFFTFPCGQIHRQISLPHLSRRKRSSVWLTTTQKEEVEQIRMHLLFTSKLQGTLVIKTPTESMSSLTHRRQKKEESCSVIKTQTRVRNKEVYVGSDM